jgi:hypothetical protein
MKRLMILLFVVAIGGCVQINPDKGEQVTPFEKEKQEQTEDSGN